MPWPSLPYRTMTPQALDQLPTVLEALTQYWQGMQASASVVLQGLGELEPETMPAPRLHERLAALVTLFHHTLYSTMIVGSALQTLFVGREETDWQQAQVWSIEDEAAPTD